MSEAVTKKARLNYLDVLRVIAILPVIVCHYTRSQEYAGVGFVNKILPDSFFSVYLGDYGVAIFFAVSGAALMYTYAGRLDVKKYIYKRFIGILPMYWMAWYIAYVYMSCKTQQLYKPAPAWKLVLTLFGMDGYANWYGTNWYLLGEWFLGCLILLYILFPLLKLGIEKKPVLTAIIILAVYVAGSIFYHGTIPTANFFLFRVPEFAFGMYFVHYGWKIKWPLGLAGIAILAVMWFADLSMIPVLYRNTVLGIVTFCVVACFCSYVKWNGFYKVCRIIGKYGYAVFLTHHFIVQEMMYLFTGKVFTIWQNYAVFALFLVVTAVASVALYWLNDITLRKIREFRQQV